MEKVTIELKSSADFNIIRIDDVEVMRAPGIRVVDLEKGNHVLTWQIKGQMGDTYDLQITSPSRLAYTRKATLDHNGLDFGFHSFTV
ncbi:hypothetical protein RT717_11240 [Imperialibacter roseus]|uniref:Uncharacterized protein n=1 Tax=Imperialibacter roseus TaxID=1324217 RepID=A0ABZ0IWP4_9BACT|nr:hypothetical protein [Imperialibacter roseus]WOK09211.1 hypothetical protein RT717_11240 [Imperialibacter roseus]